MLFERFRRPRWQHRDPAVRRQEVARLSPQDPEQGRNLRVLALEDPDDSVRAVATKRLDDLAALRRISQAESAADVREAASLRYRQLLAGGIGSDGGVDQRLAELGRTSEAPILAHVVRNAREEAMRAAALERITDSGVIEQVALNDELFRMRQTAVNRLTDLEILDRIAQQGRSIDRRIARMARERAARLRESEAARQRRLDELRELCESARELVDRPELQGTEHAEADRLRNRWQAMGELPEQAPKERFWVLMNRLDARLAQDRVPDGAAADEVRDELDDALAELEAGEEPTAGVLERVGRALEQLPTSAETRQVRAREWLEAGQRYLDHCHELTDAADSETRDAVVAAIAWPASLPEPAPLSRARLMVTYEASAATDERAHPEAVYLEEPASSDTDAEASDDSDRTRSLAALTSRLDELDRALDEGQYKPAQRALKAARSAAEQLGEDLPAEHERRLAQGRARVAELDDWRRFAVVPKQRDLCERMEALIDDDELAAPDRARRIRELREAWRGTGGGRSGETRELWERFNAAAEKAFEPCRAYFEREAERRQANLATRERIADQLNTFMEQTELAEVDTDELIRIRDTARSDWKAASPVDREAVSELSERFEGLMDKLSAVIDERRQSARERKQALVDELDGLLSWEDVEAASQRAKELQAAWDPAGSTWPSVERGLARAFRSACDRLFEARDAQRAAARERHQAAVAEAEGVCAELEGLEASPDAEDDALAQRVRELRARFDAIELPAGRVGKALYHRFQRAEAAAWNRCGEQRMQRDRSGLARALDHLAADGPVGELPADTPAALTEALSGIDPADAEPAARRRLLCVWLEIRAGLETPQADQALRMEQQMDRLAGSMQGGESDIEPWRCVAEWAALGGAADADERERVEAAMATILRDTAA